jgi:hypothetical protein
VLRNRVVEQKRYRAAPSAAASLDTSPGRRSLRGQAEQEQPMIQTDSEGRIALPDRALYLCSASGFVINNVVPIFHLGAHRIVQGVIMRGVADPDRPTDVERREAIEPAMRLKAVWNEDLGRSDDNWNALTGDPDDYLVWRNHAARVADLARSEDLPILFNVQSGTKQMVAGMAAGLDAAKADWSQLFIGKRPLRASLLVQAGNELRQLWLDPADVGGTAVPLQSLFRAAGLAPIAPDEAGLAYDRARAAGARRLYEAVWRDRRHDALKAVNHANAGCPQDGPLILTAEQFRRASSFYEEVLGPGALGDGRVDDPDARGFLTGRWLEQFVADELANILPRGAELHRCWRFAAAPGAAAMLEVDILLQDESQLHMIEVKSGSSYRELRPYLDRLGAFRHTVGGLAGSAWLVAPFFHLPPEKRKDFEARAAAAKIRLLTGPKSIRSLKNEVKTLFA